MADIYGRTGGPFLDQVILEQKERESAAAENRDPDFSPVNLLPLSDHKVVVEVDPTKPIEEIIATVESTVATKLDSSPVYASEEVAEEVAEEVVEPVSENITEEAEVAETAEEESLFDEQ